MTAYYNEIDPYCCDWLENLIREGLIPHGDVDRRPIQEVRPADVAGYRQCHWFAGLGGWAYAARLADWSDSKPLWTGSCPCQPFSVAGKRAGFADDRHLWPVWRDLIAECRPSVLIGEQVASASQWLALVHGDLEALGYAVGAIPVEAASVGAPHRRDRYWFVAHLQSQYDGALLARDHASELAALERGGPLLADAHCPARGRSARDADAGARGEALRGGQTQPGRCDQTVADPYQQPLGWPAIARPECHQRQPQSRLGGTADGLSPRVDGGGPWRAGWEDGVARVAQGVPARVQKLKALGNSIVPQVGAEILASIMEMDG